MLEITKRKKIREKSLQKIQNAVHNTRKSMIEFTDYLNNYTKDEYDKMITVVAMGDFFKDVGEIINKVILDMEKTLN